MATRCSGSRPSGRDDVFSAVEAWIQASGSVVQDFGLQLYDQDFDPEATDSVLHIYIPLAS